MNDFPTPWAYRGGTIYDANNRAVARYVHPSIGTWMVGIANESGTPVPQKPASAGRKKTSKKAPTKS